MAEFVHLHNHSDFSLLRASSTIKGLVKKAKSQGSPAIALTDDGNMFGSLRFYRECVGDKEKPVKPIIGCDFFLAPGSRLDKQAGENAQRYSRIVLLASSEAGYRNLGKLSSSGYTEGFYYRPRIDKEVLAQYKSDLIALSGGIGGEIPQLITRNRMDEARTIAAWYRDLFGPDRFYLELTDHGIAEQKIINTGLLELSKDLGIPVVAANDTYYLNREDAEAHDVLLCIGNKRKRHEAGRFKFSSQDFYIKSPDEMEAIFGHIDGALANTMKITEMVNIDLHLPGPLLPDYDIPQEFRERALELVSSDLDRLRSLFQAETPDIQARLDDPVNQYFIYESNTGLRKRYPVVGKELLDRLDYELYIIIKMGFTGYFLIVWDFIAWGKKHDIPVGPGRGSGAGSLVAYSLTITDIDPIRYNLLFERFLNPERVSMPDFDIDFCFERRQEVINYVTEKYGKEKVGQIITFGTLKPKAVLKDVARVLDISPDEANQITKLIPDGPTAAKLHLTDLLAEELAPKWVEEGFKPQADEVKEVYNRGGIYQELFDIAQKLEGLSRHTSLHAAGVVIGKGELTDFVPVYRDAKTGSVATQFTMDLIEDCGLVKMDFLGLKTLTLIKNTEDLIKAAKDPSFNIELASDTDTPTYDMLGQGKSAAVFQFDGEGMQRTLEMAKPTCIEDLIALNALYRPGPLEYIPQFVDSKWGRQSITYPHQSLEDILKETYGVIVYQEQVMQAAQIVGGYTLGGADLLRRAMGKKKVEEMQKHRAIFAEGAKKAHGLNEAQAGEIFDILEKFAGYGFNKSHAAAYSVLAFRTAYLKANFPAEFMAANLTNEVNNPDAFKLYLGEAKDMGLAVDAPDVNKSHKYFTVVDGHIVFGLLGLKGIGSAVVDEILAVRQAGGPFTSLQDFLERVDLRAVNKKAVETLILSSALRAFVPSRKVAIENLEKIIHIASSKKDGKKFGQTSLFEADPQEEFPEVVLEGEEYELLEMLKYEKEILGYYFSGHPLDKYRADWERSTTLDLSRPEAASSDKTYHLVAMISNIRIVITKKGSRMCIIQFEDYNGSLGSVMFSRAFEQFESQLVEDRVLGLVGTMDFKRDQVQFIINEILEPGAMAEKDAGEVHIRLKPEALGNEEALMALRGTLLSNGGRCPVFLHLPKNGETVLKVNGQLFIRSMPEVLARIRESKIVRDTWKIYPAMGPYGVSLASLKPVSAPRGSSDDDDETDDSSLPLVDNELELEGSDE